jgi:hypothetical protein
MCVKRIITANLTVLYKLYQCKQRIEKLLKENIVGFWRNPAPKQLCSALDGFWIQMSSLRNLCACHTQDQLGRLQIWPIDVIGKESAADVNIIYISASIECKLGTSKYSFIQIVFIFYFSFGVSLSFQPQYPHFKPRYAASPLLYMCHHVTVFV